MSHPPKRKQALGRGFDALISDNFDKSLLLDAEERIEKINLDKIEPNPNQPRRQFDENSLHELATSIKQHGVIQPLVVTTEKDGKYMIIAGERRWRAAQIAGLSTVPAIKRSSKELEQLEIALIENVQRVDLNALEQAFSIERLHDQFSLPYSEISARLGKAISTVNNTVRLLQLPDDAKEALISGKITEGHARALLALKNEPDKQEYLLKTIIEHGWNVRQAERFVVSIKEGVKETKEAHARTETETPETKKLSKRLGAAVQIRRMAYGGRLEIQFTSDEDLTRILTLFD
ncbi:MAG TPA: ParB/RepB/Spo0J family partition protein [Candidatus Saccharimonadales bacterium]|nr:ParB/RepB/Spo0J family partition protein [Candidatus Saccharimonadales bacterium]